MTGPFHAITCDADRGCDPTCPVARAEGLPRDPDLREYVAGQVDLLALLEGET